MEKNFFIDVQVNGGAAPGYGSLDFSQKGIEKKKIESLTEWICSKGTGAYCPTVISTSEEIYKQNLPILSRCMDTEWGKHRLAGIHLEGPFLSTKDGANGAHPAEQIIEPSISAFDDLMNLADEKVVLLTVAPSALALPLIEYASQYVVVSLGHHRASISEMEEAIAAGAKAFTHIPNASPKDEEFVNWQLRKNGVYRMFISDGDHVPDSILQKAFQVVPEEELILVSDASPLSGAPKGKYFVFEDLEVAVEEGEGVELRTRPKAGSYKQLSECVKYFSSIINENISQQQLSRYAGLNAATMLRDSWERIGFSLR